MATSGRIKNASTSRISKSPEVRPRPIFLLLFNYYATLDESVPTNKLRQHGRGAIAWGIIAGFLGLYLFEQWMPGMLGAIIHPAIRTQIHEPIPLHIQFFLVNGPVALAIGIAYLIAARVSDSDPDTA